MLWLHVLAIGYSPLYLSDNSDAIGNDWPHVPLPDTAEALLRSAAAGARLAALLDVDTPLPGVDINASPRLSQIGEITSADESTARRVVDLSLTAGWGRVQTREQRSGATSRIVMPGKGRISVRHRTIDEASVLSDSEASLLGDDVLDVYLNDATYWRDIPEGAWNFKIGGFQVLRKWLSYRDSDILGRALTVPEVREFRSLARRLTELVLIGAELDDNYKEAAGMVDQDPLPDLYVRSPG
jgi:hypothetical protein